jgi:glycosyltransferase involved in cell wall biosynthesis
VIDERLRGLRILAFCDYYGPGSIGGSERVAREIYARLARAGARVLVISGLEGVAYDDPGVEVAPFRTANLSGLVGAQLSVTPLMYLRAKRLARQFDPHVVSAQTFHFHGSLVASRVATRMSVPLVTVAHVAGLEHLRGVSRVLAEAHERTIGRVIIRRSTGVVAVSDAVRTHAIARGAPRLGVRVVHNGVDSDTFRPTPETNENPPNVLFVGRLIANKGPDVLLEAVRILCKRGIEFTATFVGDGPMLEQLRTSAIAESLPASFPGSSPDVASWMHEAAVVVRPSFTEGMPLTLLEAMASQRCVLASDIPANAELVDNGRTGLLHRPGDASHLADQLAELIDNPDLRARLAEAAHIESKAYSWDETARGHADAWLDAISSRS